MTYLNEEGEYDYDDDADRYNMPSDFEYYTFGVKEEEDPWGGSGTATVVYFAPLEYFRENGYMFDSYMPVEDKLPNLFGQACEATYTFKGDVATARATCEALGFTVDDKFQRFIEVET